MGLEILVADDEALIRLGLRAMLEEMGHQVTLATDGREALRLARQRAFDLAIFDIKMPLTDGLQAAQTLSRTAPLPSSFWTATARRPRGAGDGPAGTRLPGEAGAAGAARGGDCRGPQALWRGAGGGGCRSRAPAGGAPRGG